MQRKTAAAVALGAIGAMAPAAGAQHALFEYEILAVEGDPVSGVGAITGLGPVAIAGAEWLVEVDTDHPDPAADGVVLKGGALLLREGQPLPEPPGATLRGVGALGMSAAGDVGGVLLLGGTGSAADDSGVYFNDALLVQEGDISSAPGLGGAMYRGFTGAALDRDGRILTLASAADPAMGVIDALMVFERDASTGAAIERVLVKEGDVLPGTGAPVVGFAAAAHSSDLAGSGQALYIAQFDGPAGADEALYLDDAMLAQEGAPSPVAGRNWGSFDGAAVALGRHAAIRSRVDGDPATSEVVAHLHSWGPETIAQQGGPVPGEGGATFTSFGKGPIGVGSVLGLDSIYWYGAWAGGEALFRDQAPMVVAGETVVEGSLVAAIDSGAGALAVSDDGRQVIARVTLEGGAGAVILIEATPIGCGYCGADCDCSGSLDFFDFLCFQNAFAAGHPAADCDDSGDLTFFDFLCFQDSMAC